MAPCCAAIPLVRREPSDIPLEPTPPQERRTQQVSKARSGNGATHSRTQRRRSEYGEHGEYPPFDMCEYVATFVCRLRGERMG